MGGDGGFWQEAIVVAESTLARVFSLIEPEEFQKCLFVWMSKYFELLNNDIINIDGKSLCGSARPSHEQKATHIANAYLAKEQITLAEVRVPDKTNEIKAIPMLLKSLNVEGAIITIDAMGAQRGIANLIRIKKANYVLSVKENHKKFYRNADTFRIEFFMNPIKYIMKEWCARLKKQQTMVMAGLKKELIHFYP